MNDTNASTLPILDKALQVSEARYRRLFESAQDGILILNALTAQIDDVNPFLIDLLGYSHAEFLGKKLWEIGAFKDTELTMDEFAELQATRFVRYDDLPLVTKDGRRISVEYVSNVYDCEGIDVIQCNVRDNTKRHNAELALKQTERQLMQAQKMESIGQLTGGIAHDFNNMLGAMLGYAEILQLPRADEAPLSDRAHQHVSQIITAGNRAKELIAQMLIFSRLNKDSISDETPIILLQPVIEEVVKLLRSSIPTTIEITYHVTNEQLKTRIQPVQLHQILMNLIVNARDAIGEYGSIVVSLRQGSQSGMCYACHQSYSGDYIELTVCDSGGGIPEQLLTKIFDPFFTTKEVGKGTGMGLSVVHGIVHTLGGHIRLASSEAGTSIHILLPLAEVSALSVTNKRQSPEVVEGSLSGFNIMVVDDEYAMVSMLKEILTIYGAKVSPYNSPIEALSAFERNPTDFDLVITDETMPKLSGLDMAKIMLKLRPQLPILLCTGYSDHLNQEVAKQNGIAGFMYKPVDLPKMLQWIKDRRYAIHH